MRAAALETLGFAGVEIDPERNEAPGRGIRVISTDASRVTVLVVPTNEELEIARQTLQAAGALTRLRALTGYRAGARPHYACMTARRGAAALTSAPRPEVPAWPRLPCPI